MSQKNNIGFSTLQTHNPTMKKLTQAALTIGGSDSCAGAGIQADLKTFQRCSVYGASVVTAVTAQNTVGVSAAQTLATSLVSAQLQAVFCDLPIKSIKTGMLASADIVTCLVSELSSRPDIPLIIDPVLQATTGASLASDDTSTALVKSLLPLAELITPNLAETELLTGIHACDRNSMLSAGLRLLDSGCQAVLVKGGHLEAADDNYLYDLLLSNNEQYWFKHQRRPGEYHGTGCTLSAAICAGRARGLNLHESVSYAIDYVQSCINNAVLPQQGKIALLIA